MSAKLKEAFVDVVPQLIPASGGKYDVYINDKLVFSKEKVGDFPNEDKLVADLLASYKESCEAAANIKCPPEIFKDVAEEGKPQ